MSPAFNVLSARRFASVATGSGNLTTVVGGPTGLPIFAITRAYCPLLKF